MDWAIMPLGLIGIFISFTKLMIFPNEIDSSNFEKTNAS